MHDNLVEHLEKSANQLIPSSAIGEKRGQLAWEYVQKFLAEAPADPHLYDWEIEFPRSKILDVMHRLLLEQRFQVGKGPDWEGGLLNGQLEDDYSSEGGWLSALPRLTTTLRLSFRVNVSVDLKGKVQITTSRRLPTWVEEFRSQVVKRLARSPQSGSKPVKDPLLAPGKPLSAPFEGTLLDYSGCATEDELSDLRRTSSDPEALPLGIRAFGFPPRRPHDKPVDYGNMLYLNPLSNNALREHQGTLICAPQNSGKTELIVRWAQAANRLGYNIFLVDVKGNLYDKLMGSDWQGDLYYLTTNPREIAGFGSREVYAVNFLANLDLSQPESVMRVSQLAAAILPPEGFERGEESMYYQNRLSWLTAMIQAVLLDQAYQRRTGRDADLSDVYEIASSESALLRTLVRIDAGEQKSAGDRKLPGFAALFDALSVLITPGVYPRSGEYGEPGTGQRAEYSYRWLTEGLVSALRPFAAHGTLYSKTNGRHSSPHFTFESLAGLNLDGTPNDRQVAVLLAARLQDMEDSKSLLSLAIARLEQALWDRMEALQKSELRTVLLLLDETRRIRNFKTNEYVTYAREAKAGCVVAYQSLDQIGTNKQITELLENIGTQIYLGSLTGNTARNFIANLPKRYRPVFSHGKTEVGEPAETLQTGHELIDYFSTIELFRLPAGKYPALIYLNDQPRRKPFLVTMEKDRLKPFVKTGGKK